MGRKIKCGMKARGEARRGCRCVVWRGNIHVEDKVKVEDGKMDMLVEGGLQERRLDIEEEVESSGKDNYKFACRREESDRLQGLRVVVLSDHRVTKSFH